MAARDTLPGLFNLLFKFVWIGLLFLGGIGYFLHFEFTFFGQSSHDETPLTIWNYGLPYFTTFLFIGWFSKDLFLGVRSLAKRIQALSFLFLVMGTAYHSFFLGPLYGYWLSSDFSSFEWAFSPLPIISSLGLLINRIIRWRKS